MAEIDSEAFGEAVGARLVALKVDSFRKAVEKWPALNVAMLSRACSAQPVSAANMLLLCRYLGLDPFAFLIETKRRRVTMKSILNQTVTVRVARET